ETVCQQHPCRMDMNSCNTVLGGDGTYHTVWRSFFRNQGAVSLRVHCIENTYRNIVALRRENTLWMQNLCTKVSQLGCFIKTQVCDRFRTTHHTRVIVVHAIDICPDLNLIGPQSRPDKGSRVVRTTAAEVVYFTKRVATDIALCDE